MNSLVCLSFPLLNFDYINHEIVIVKRCNYVCTLIFLFCLTVNRNPKNVYTFV